MPSEEDNLEMEKKPPVENKQEVNPESKQEVNEEVAVSSKIDLNQNQEESTDSKKNNKPNLSLKVEEEKQEPKRSPFRQVNKKSPAKGGGAFLFPKKSGDKVRFVLLSFYVEINPKSEQAFKTRKQDWFRKEAYSAQASWYKRESNEFQYG